MLLRDDGAELELEDLSEHEQKAVLFAVTIDRVGLARSIVLIDLPELFVAPKDHARFLGALAGLGEDNQILAATTSEPILAAAEATAVVQLPGGRTSP